MDEKTLVNEGGVVVSSTRFVVGGKTYPLAGITSVEAFTISAKRVPGIVLVALGVILLVVLFQVVPSWTIAVGCGGILIVIGGAAAAAAKTKYAVRVATAGMQANALVSPDRQRVQRIVDALNQAIVQRG